MGDEKLHLFGEYVLDTARGCLLRAGHPVHLRPQAYKALKYLAENNGRLISKDHLIEEVWAGRAVSDDSLVQCLRDVRQALGDGDSQYLRTERGRGYIFDLGLEERGSALALSTRLEQLDVVRVVFEDEESDEVNAPALPPIVVGPHPGLKWGNGGRKAVLAAAGLSVLILTIVAAYRFYPNREPSPTRIESIAILPFLNESGNPDIEYLSDGISESLINRLSQLPQLKVIARNSAFEYKGKAANLQEVSRTLGVQAILLGRVAQRGDDLVVSVELVDARDRTQIWGERYTRRRADIQAVQEEMARTISEKLRVKLTGAQEEQLTKRATRNQQANELYLTGMFYYRKPGIEGVKKSLDYFNQSVALDPNFALAWVEVARANRFLVGHSLLDPKEALPRAKAAVQKALESDETLAEAHVELASTRKDEWDWAGAEREFKRAIELNPNLAEAHNKYSSYLSVMGRHTEALAENKRAQELDPLRIGLRGNEAAALMLARRYDEAIEKLKQFIELNPSHGISHGMLGLMYNGKGMYEQAIGEFQKAMSIIGETTSIQIYLGYALAMSGQRGKAQAILARLKTTKEYVSPSELAYLYIALGDKEGAMAMLERAYAARDPLLQNLKIDSYYDSLRTDPRFVDLLLRVGLAP
jgi:TolB-like protein/DNA-binding winged helix-turn-helix (wHTH) protein/Tfp pilus assembly protein PilF